MDISIKFSNVKNSIEKLAASFIYFFSNMATTAFGALNTILVGIYMQDIRDVAYWSVSMTLISGVQSLYSPIISGVYPRMLNNPSIKLIRGVLVFFLPIIVLGCIISYIIDPIIISVFAGDNYENAVPVFRMLISVLIVSFPAMLIGWPTLGSIGKVREVTRTTVLAAVFQTLELALFVVLGMFSLISISILRSITAVMLSLLRIKYYWIYRKMFD